MRRAFLGWSVVGALAGVAFGQPVDGGGYVELDGVDDSVISRASFDLPALTVEAWVRVDDSHPEFASGIVTWGSREKGSWDFAVSKPGDARLRFFINYNNGTQRGIVGATALTPGAWHHVAATYDGFTAALYVDGQLDAVKDLADPINLPGDNPQLTIGDDYPGASEFIRGGVDEVKIWSNARSGDDIARDMYELPTRGGGEMYAYYDFNECRTNVVVDQSGNGRHAHLGSSYSVAGDDGARAIYAENRGRTRCLELTSSDAGGVDVLPGGLAEQIAGVNAGKGLGNWSPITRRRTDMHVRMQFPCPGLPSSPYVDAATFLAGADEVTRNNCDAALYRFPFTLPKYFDAPAVYGAANADDLGVMFVNAAPVTPALTMDDATNLGVDRVEGEGHRVLGWPSTDPIFDLDGAGIVPGANEVLVGVVGDASAMEPTGVEFVVHVRYDCVADWNADGVEDTRDFSSYTADWAAREPEADMNGDGKVNTIDWIEWFNNWTFGCPE